LSAEQARSAVQFNYTAKKPDDLEIRGRRDGKMVWAGILHRADQGDPGHALRMALRRARRAAGMTQVIAAERLRWSVSKVSRIETGRVGTSLADVEYALRAYAVTDEGLAESIVELARRARIERRLAENNDG
jgi:hypothetical protein